MTSKFSKIAFFSLFLGFLIIGFFIGVFFERGKDKDSLEDGYSILHSNIKDNKFTNPILDCNPFSQTQSPAYTIIRHNVQNIVNNRTNENKISDIAVYFRDMQTGAWVGVNEKMKFAPASLLKVPILMSYFKEAEKDKSILNKKIKYENLEENNELNITQNIKPTINLKNNEEYEVSALLEAMIIDSDNQAMVSLVKDMPDYILDRVYLELGLVIPGVRAIDDFMTVYEYGSFFRILYNATYLNEEYSEKALELLDKTEFRDGLRSGVPEHVPIAKKFGERAIGQFGQKVIKQLHDCGIVYYPDRPYFLCVMTRGTDFDAQSNVIGEISRMVYSEINEFNQREN